MNTKSKSILKILILLISLLLAAVVAKKIVFKKTPGQNITDAKHKAMMVKLEAIKSALDLYKLENGKYPDKINLLFNENKKYIANQKFLYDLWDRPYVYQLDESKKECILISFGADGKPGGTELNKDISIQFQN